MALVFPTNPTNGQLYTYGNTTYSYNATRGFWAIYSSLTNYGSNTQILYNNGASLVGSPNLTFTTSNSFVVGANTFVANATSNTVTANSYLYPTGEGVAARYTLDDISSKFDGTANSFALTVNGTQFIPNNPNQLDISMGGVKIYPTKYIQDYVNQTEIYTFTKGFFVDSTGNVNFVSAPSSYMTFYGTVETNNDVLPAYTYANTPFSAINIMLSY